MRESENSSRPENHGNIISYFLFFCSIDAHFFQCFLNDAMYIVDSSQDDSFRSTF